MQGKRLGILLSTFLSMIDVAVAGTVDVGCAISGIDVAVDDGC